MAKTPSRERSVDAAKAAQDAIAQTNLEQAQNTKRLMDEAAQKLADERVAAEKKVADDTARAEEEALRMLKEAEDAKIAEVEAAKAVAAKDAADKIVVSVPKAFKLNLDNHKIVNYPAGVYAMPKRHAEHWWSRANGVVPWTEVAESVEKSTGSDQVNANAQA